MNAVADYLRDHRFKALFTESLGWDHATGTVRVSVGGRDFEFTSIAHKRGIQVLQVETDYLVIVNRALLRWIQKFVSRTCHEHILIYFCEQPRKQMWR